MSFIISWFDGWNNFLDCGSILIILGAISKFKSWFHHCSSLRAFRYHNPLHACTNVEDDEFTRRTVL